MLLAEVAAAARDGERDHDPIANREAGVVLTHLDDFARFIQASPSSFHAAAEAARRLDDAGFTALDETAEWPTGPGRRYVVRDGAVIAWIEPATATATTPFRVVGAHTDSPGFMLKPKPTTGTRGWLQAGVEVYGGPLFNSWLDRDLEFAGRLVTLSPTEYALLIALASRAGQPVSQDRLTTEVWGQPKSSNIVEVYVGYLRRKLGADRIRTVRGAGYVLDG